VEGSHVGWARKVEIYMVQNRIYLSHGPQGSRGAKIGKTIFTCVYGGEIFKKKKNFSLTPVPGKFKYAHSFL
jgi:hypothetical protein